MPLTTFALEKIGYVRLDADETISGRFWRQEVFEIRGFNVEDETQVQFQAAINHVPLKFAVGNEVNALSQSLLDHDFTDDEEVWLKEKRVNPPFVMVLFGPTAEHRSSGTHFKEASGEVETYESFEAARAELKTKSEAANPSLLAALRMTFSSTEKPVRFRRVATAFFGVRADGKLIKDLRLEFRAEAYRSDNLSREAVNEKLRQAIDMAKAFDPKVAQFHMLGAEETDPLKRFLFLFLFVERLINATYAKIDHDTAISDVLSHHSRLSEAGARLLGDHRRSWKDLRSRFVWCAMHSWTHLNDADIKKFEKAKTVRDDLAHGKIVVPSGDAVLEVEQLALRLNSG